ncbi:MAG: hypothetical protein UT81_C0010G0001, partial [Parcubacteria group bacterium GW2011_GWA2_40_14]
KVNPPPVDLLGGGLVSFDFQDF